ncbi:hypothetical protein JMJ77_0007730, partial [Colletotrichum scovillei]
WQHTSFGLCAFHDTHRESLSCLSQEPCLPPNQSQTLQLTADRDDERNSFSLEDTKTPTSSQEEAKKPRRPSRSQGKSSRSQWLVQIVPWNLLWCFEFFTSATVRIPSL